LAFGIKISPHHHTPFTTPRDWHGVLSMRSSFNANHGVSRHGEGCGDILIPKANGTLSGCILSWIHEITGF